MAKDKNSVLSDFRPYEWYDISLYPTNQNARYSSHPRVDVIAKVYDSETDKFRYYKTGATYHDGYDNKGWSGVQPGHRVIAFMHDGNDLPLYDHKNGCWPDSAPTEPPIIRDRKISNERRTVKYCNGSSGDCYWQEPLNESAEVPMLNSMVTHPENGAKFKVEGLNTLDRNNPVVYIRPLTGTELINV